MNYVKRAGTINGLVLQVVMLALIFVPTAWCSSSSIPAPTEVPVITGANAAQPSLSHDGEGGFVLTWQEHLENRSSLHFARIQADGEVVDQGLIARNAPGKTWFVNWADFPSLTVLDNGDWVTFWLQKSGSSVYAYDIQLTRSTDQGRNWSAPVSLNRDNTESEHGFVSLVPAGEDRVLAIWLDGRNTVAPNSPSDSEHENHAGGMTLRSAMANRSGAISEEQEIDTLTCDCCNTDLVQLEDAYMTVYRDRTEDEIRDTSYSLLSVGGDWSPPQAVYEDHWKIAACPVNGPALAAQGEQVLAVWTTMEEDHLSVRAAVANSSGFGKMTPVESGDKVQGRVDAVAFGENDFLLSWLGHSDSDPEATAIRLAVFTPESGLSNQQVVADLPVGRSTGFPRMASAGNIAFITWTEPGTEGSSIRVMRLSH